MVKIDFVLINARANGDEIVVLIMKQEYVSIVEKNLWQINTARQNFVAENAHHLKDSLNLQE